MDLRFLRLERVLRALETEATGVNETTVRVITDGVHKVYLDGVESEFAVAGPQTLTVPSTSFDVISITRSSYEPGYPARALLRWQGGFMEGVEQLLFDLFRAMMGEGGLGSYMQMADASEDPKDILARIQVATTTALKAVIARQAKRRVPPSRQPVAFTLTGIEVDGYNLIISHDLKTKVSRTEFSLWL